MTTMRSPRKNMERSPRKNMERSPRKNMERSPRKNMERSPRKNMERSPHKNMERSPRKNMERGFTVPVAGAAAFEFISPSPKTSPVKEHIKVKPHFSPVVEIVSHFSLNNSTRPVHNKENANSKEHDRNSELLRQSGVLEDSGYLSLQNSHIDDHHDNHEDECDVEEQSAEATSPPTCIEGIGISTKSLCKNTIKVCAQSTPASCRRKLDTFSKESTPVDAQPNDTNLPIVKFQHAVCKELAKSFQKTQRYDWTVVGKLADDFLLDRVIGRQMGLEYVDVLSSLLSRDMRSILSYILCHLGDMDLIRCKKVSKTWRKIISEDKAAFSRCQVAEQRLRESRSSLDENACSLTRDVTLSRVVLSCMQTLASSTPSSAWNARPSRRTPNSQKKGTPSQNTRFNEYLEAASCLKQHESLCRCKRCGSPAKNLLEAQRATCTRSSCLFDFCTRCQEAFHGSSPCRTSMLRPHPSSKSNILIGSARSKRNVRRL